MSHPAFDLTGKTALITGSSRGIGFALAHGLAAAGATIILNGRNPQSLEQARKNLAASFPKQSLCYLFDVTDEAEVTETIGQIEVEIGGIDILINNAGMQHRAPLLEFPLEQFQAIMRTNVESAFIVSKAVAPGMIRRGHGKIIHIASLMTRLARKDIAAYTTSKGAIRNLTQAMCVEWAAHNLQINAIGPGYFKTELTQALVDDPQFNEWLIGRTPAGRWGDLEDLTGAAVFLASPASNFVNGQVLHVDGGISAVV